MKERKTRRSLCQFGTRVARAMWPEKRGVRQLGVLTLGLCALLGVTRASNLRKLYAGANESTPTTQTKFTAQTVSTAPVATAPATADNSAVETTDAQDAQSGAPNIVDLIGDSELIFRGTVKELTDGVENGLPYTQVTVQVSEALRGQFGEEYTFRQFGLLKPRKMENGKVNLTVTPDGWAKYKANEDVVLFLYKRASVTGLRTTVGLGQGKLEVGAGNINSQFDNDGLFSNVEVDGKMLNDRDKRLLATKKGPVNKESFMSFVRRAVNEKWVEGGKMRHAKK